MVGVSDCRLAAFRRDDIAPLHTLLSDPQVYHYLADGKPPERRISEAWVEESLRSFAANGYGGWRLEAGGKLKGAVLLEELEQPRTAELTYLLHPGLWKGGIATAMAWTVIEYTFRLTDLETIIAGADAPNTGSIAVMKRLGMRFLRDVDYPSGPGVEYIRERSDLLPAHVPATLPIVV